MHEHPPLPPPPPPTPPPPSPLPPPLLPPSLPPSALAICRELLHDELATTGLSGWEVTLIVFVCLLICGYVPMFFVTRYLRWDDAEAIAELVARRDEAVKQCDAAIAERDAAIVQRDAATLRCKKAVSQRDEALAKRDEAVSRFDEATARCSEAGTQREQAHAEYLRMVEEAEARSAQERAALSTMESDNMRALDGAEAHALELSALRDQLSNVHASYAHEVTNLEAQLNEQRVLHQEADDALARTRAKLMDEREARAQAEAAATLRVERVHTGTRRVMRVPSPPLDAQQYAPWEHVIVAPDWDGAPPRAHEAVGRRAPFTGATAVLSPRPAGLDLSREWDSWRV